jgi:hypothetical protein
MKIGMLWFDNDQNTSIPSKVKRAASYYQKKYGVDPDICYVNPVMVNGGNGKKSNHQELSELDQINVDQIQVLENDQVLPDHFWIGVHAGDDTIS